MLLWKEGRRLVSGVGAKSVAPLLSVLLLSACAAPTSDDATGAIRLSYPETRQDDRKDTYHSQQVADPYRWLETMDSSETKAWIEAQNNVAKPFLESIPARERIKARLTELWNFERYEVPVKEGGRYFFKRNDGLQDQSVLYVAPSLEAEPRPLLDPNTLSADRTVALEEFVPSDDGSLLAYALSDGGTDWRTWHVRDVSKGEDLPDVLRGIKFREVAWRPDGKALYYARYPLGADGTADDSKQMEVYLHELGTPQSNDRPIYRITDHPRRYPYPTVSSNGRFLIFNIFDGYQSTGIHVQRLNDRGMPTGDVERVFDAFDGNYQYVGTEGDRVFVLTTANAPNGRILAARITSNGFKVEEVVPTNAHALVEVVLSGEQLIAHYLKDVSSRLTIFDLQGRVQREVKLPGLGQVPAISGNPQDSEAFFAYTDFLTPTSIIRLDSESGATNVFKAPKVNVDVSRFVVEQVFYTSKDGTKVPMYIAHRRDIRRDGATPTLLYGYGGFAAPQQASFSVPNLVWLEMGGVYALANLRGGSEYGDAWHTAGTKLQKQNVFDDFIAAAEYLIAQRYTSPAKLAIRGRSNGGLLVGAALTQRPDLFGAALPNVGVLDMLRYHTASANAYQWSSDYGTVEEPKMFEALRAYSPVHNVKRGTCYPPTLVTTADRDDRVVPWHSYKFAAALQAGQSCNNPILLRVETRAGHGSGKPVWMQIEDYADQWAFLVKALGMEG